MITNFSMPKEKEKAALKEKKRMQAVKQANMDSVIKKERAYDQRLRFMILSVSRMRFSLSVTISFRINEHAQK